MTARQLTDLPYDQQHLVDEVSERLAPKFAGVAAHHAHLVILLVQIVQQDVAQRYHANQSSLVANGQVAETVASHQSHAVFQVFVHADGEGIVGHDLSHAGAAGITSFRHDALHQVAFGKNPDQFAIVQDGHGADVVLNHESHRFEHGVAQFRLKCVLIFDQVADTHLTPSGGYRG